MSDTTRLATRSGLYDQVLVLQKYVDKVAGDNSRVSAWGEPAAGGSALEPHSRGWHTRPSIQKKRCEWAWDIAPGSRLDTTFRNLSRLAVRGVDCKIACLGAVSSKSLTETNHQLLKEAR
ncbi:Carboxylesterase [Tolypocladium paradoxum]|uniref:Carboxylesterase n=1 Tax=Tolypocladium paradoxum TaxID=94208 RepID=A0A2S4KZ29_9HYPO|nr:Carboxylesterase [Tolypocladium paradoxum]